jgi:amidase
MTLDLAATEPGIAELQAAMASGAETAASIAEAYLGRIEAADRAGPRLNAVIQVNPDAMAIAAALDAERRAGRVRGPLHGIPILVKDNIATGDRMETTAGSLALVGARPAADAALVTALREAGAVILGKTNLSEWANIRSRHSTSGWSGRGGLTRNPYALDRNASGSSSGSGAAVAANLCVVAIGTETDGSIVAPATVNGIVGIKPTVGLVSQAGIVPISHSQDTAGPMARTVADAATVLEVLAGRDAFGATPASGPVLPGVRIGAVRGAFEAFLPAVQAIAAAALAALRDLGAEIVDVVDFASPRIFEETKPSVLLTEFKADLNAYLAALPPGPHPRTLTDVIAFNEANRDRELQWFGQDLFLEADQSVPLTDPAYLEALATNRRLAREDGIDRALSANTLDALFVPTGNPAHLTDLVNGDPQYIVSSTFPAIAGYPHVTVPAGFVHGLPVGVSFVGTANTDAALVGIAAAFENATQARRPPTYPATLDLGETS